MSMTKKHFEAVAEVLSAEFAVQQNNPSAQIAVKAITFSLADKFAKENPRFDRATFYKASGIRA